LGLPNLVLASIGEVFNAIIAIITNLTHGILTPLTYIGPFAPVIIIIIGGAVVLAIIWLLKRIYELL
jgi:hypothetical protein